MILSARVRIIDGKLKYEGTPAGNGSFDGETELQYRVLKQLHKELEEVVEKANDRLAKEGADKKLVSLNRAANLKHIQELQQLVR